MLRQLLLAVSLSLVAVPVLADSDDNLDLICLKINCSEAAGLPMSLGIEQLGSSSNYSLQATIYDGFDEEHLRYNNFDEDHLRILFTSPYSPSDSAYNLETRMYGRELAWQAWLDAEGPQTTFHEVGDQIVSGPGNGPSSVADVPEPGTLDLMVVGLFAIACLAQKRRYRAMFQ